MEDKKHGTDSTQGTNGVKIVWCTALPAEHGWLAGFVELKDGTDFFPSVLFLQLLQVQ